MSDERDDSEITDLETSYTLLGELGRGGSAIVYRALDRALHRDVAIKVVRPRLSLTGEEALARLVREARTVARLQHPNIVTVHAVKRLRDGGLALVMQLIPGRTLKEALAQDGAFAPERAERVLKDVAEALAFAHANGVVHRDVKPENIFLDDSTGRALLSDFGIAHSTEFDSRLTMDGAAIGTPAYMAPEQIDGATANARSDVYSLGLVAWEMLTGVRPWEGEALYNVIFKQKHEDVPAIDALRPGVVPPRLQYIVERMMQKRPSARWAGADGLLTVLNNWVVPSDWKQWEASHRRRREAARVKAKTKPSRRLTPVDASGPESLSTVRFTRPTAADQTVAAGVAVRTSAAAMASSASAGVAPATTDTGGQDDAPSWATVAVPPSRSRRWMVVAGLLLLAGGAGGTTYARRQGFFDTRFTSAGSLAESRAIDLPIVSASSGDSAAGRDRGVVGLTDSLRADSIRVDSAARQRGLAEGALARRVIDSVRADSMVEAAMRRATIRAAAAAPPVSRPMPATMTSPVSAPVDAPAVRATDDAGVIAAGGRHSCSLVSGKVFCWGANERGQLGDGDVESRDVPAPIVGDLVFVHVATGLAHSCGVARGGEAYCWGGDDRGQLGDATTTARSAPVRVAGNHTFRLLRAGLSHTCGLTTSGEVACWGANTNGQLGDGSTTTRSSPVIIGAGMRFVSLSAGWNHSCAIAADGIAWCWGANASGQLGTGVRADARTPVAVAGGQHFSSISAGGQHSCAVSDSSEAWCWGRNSYGQLGGSGATDQAMPVRVETGTRFASVTAGGVHSCGRTRTGQAWCWGRNVYGQLGDGSNSNRETPTRVIGGASFQSLNATGAHTCGAASDGETYCWGFNVEGQLGDGTRNHNARPTRVTLGAR